MSAEDCEITHPGGLSSRTARLRTERTRSNRVIERPAAALGKLRVGFVLVQPFTLTTFAGFIDALRLAADDDDRSRQIDCEWSILGHEDEDIVSSCGVPVRPWAPMNDPTRYDYVAVVGGMLHNGQKVHGGTYAYLRKAAQMGVPLIGLCTGSFILARAGLLQGYDVCVSRFHRARFQNEFPDLKVQSSQMFLVDRDRLTCVGGTSTVHLAAHLIEKHVNRARAVKCLRLLYEENPLPVNAWQPEAMIAHQAKDLIVRQAMQIIEQDLAEPEKLAVLSKSLGVNLRQLERRFISNIGITPREYRLRLRLARAKWLIEQTDRSMTEIALESGFNNCSHFSNTFKSHFNSKPSDVRRSARQSAAQ
ncbi:MAG: GlxA family transcriptional regulator [Rhodospirillaceae bacterium]